MKNLVIIFIYTIKLASANVMYYDMHYTL